MKQSSTLSGNLLLRRVIFYGYVAAVLGATLAPFPADAYDAVAGLDKLVHVVLFGGVAVLLCWTANSVSPQSARRVFLTTTAFAAIIELVQSLLVYRSGDVWDLVAGSIGAILGIFFALAIAKFWVNRREKSS